MHISDAPIAAMPSVNDTDLANSLRALAMDAVQAANSGHPGAPMGMAEMAVALWSKHLRHNPANPRWVNRDRFVLSNGHASMLLYSLLHLTGYELPIKELQSFRQLHSRTPGHPEYGLTPGVETTTGPLGQGLANAVGFALAEKLLADEFNRPDHSLVDHHTYVFLGDGCLMEGVSHEACALAGVWRLNKLIALYDDNGISIDGPVKAWFGDDTAGRFRAYGWNVIGPIDGHQSLNVEQAITQAKACYDAPTLIICRTVIGKGAPSRAGTAKAHGEPLGPAEVDATRAAIGWPHAPFEIPASISAQWDARALGAELELRWRAKWQLYQVKFPQMAAEFERRMAGRLPEDFDQSIQACMSKLHADRKPIASRKSSQNVLAELAPRLGEMVGGSADLTGSNLTDFPGCGAVRGGVPGGRHINYGVREFAMAAIMNGMALHGGFIPYGGTFLTFSDYSRNAIRMAALMKLCVVHVFTHDSVGLGEDGPTHQPVEHVASLRLIPNLDVWRPADSFETAAAWGAALKRGSGPTALILSRQNLAQLDHPDTSLDNVGRGGYVLSPAEGPKAVIIATGSEVSMALAAQRLLAQQGLPVNVVSMPCTSQFDRQSADYREKVLPRELPKIAVEAGVSHFWRGFGCVEVLGIDRFGESAPAQQVFESLGFTAESLAQLVKQALRNL